MKKILLFLLTLMIGFNTLQVSAQETLTVHDGTSTNSYVPVYGFYADAYLKAEFVIPANDLVDMTGGNITSMKFYASNSSVDWGTSEFQVFLAEVNNETISAFEGTGNATVVYNGTLSLTNNEMVVTFANGYVYTGGNLLIGFYDTNPDEYESVSWYGETVNGASVQGYSYSDLASVSPTQRNFIPKTTFTYTPSGTNCFSPNSPAISDISSYEATLSWTPRDGQNEWEVCCVSGNFDPDQANWQTVIDTSYTFTNLTPATGYTAYVRTNCGSEVSNPRSVNFTTIATCASLPTHVMVSNITATTVDVSWTAGAANDIAWEVVVVPANATPESGIPEQATDQPYTVFDLQDNTQYKVYVRTDCGGGDHSYWSDPASFTTQPLCTSPVHVNVSQITGTSALVSWEPAVFGATSYTVEYSLDSLEDWTMEVVDGTQFMISNLEPGTTYNVMVYSNCDLSTADTIEKTFTTNCLAGGNLQIGDGTITSGYLPEYCLYNYSYTQQIFLASELSLDDATEISSIAFQAETIANANRHLKIYLMNTTAANSNSWLNATNATLVYDNTPTLTTGWNTFHFNTPFQYDGTSNLAVIVLDVTGSWSGTNMFYCHTTSQNMARYVYQDASSYSTTSTPSGGENTSSRNNVIFGTPCEEDVTCVRPNVYVTETSESSITIDWAPGYNETAWNVEYSANDSDWTSLGSVNTHPYEVTGLDPDTRYYIRVNSDCGSETSNNATVSARTECSSIEIPYSEDFDDAPGSGEGNMITCWTANTNNSTEYPYTSNSNQHSGDYSVYFYGSTSYYSYLTSPRIDDMVAMDNLQVRFWARKSTASYYIQVGIMTDPNDYSTFQQIGQNLTPDTINTWQLLQVNTDSYAGDGRYIAFRTPVDISNYMYIDDVTIDIIPSCEHVENITSVNGTVTANAADITWTVVGTEGAWDVVYGISGTITDPNDETATTVQSPSISLTDLNNNTLYDVYVKAVCSGDESSIWMSYTFRTACGEIANLPFTENFDTYGTGTGTYPTCWDKINTYSSDRPYINSSNYEGVGSLYFFAGSTGTYNIAITPIFDATIDINTLQAEFMYKASYTSDRLIIGVISDPTDATTFVAVDTVYPHSTASTWIPQEVSFASYTGNGRYIAFKNQYTSQSAYAYIDNLNIDLIPSCPKPTHVTAASGATDTVVLSWTDANATQWDIIYGPTGFDPTEDLDPDEGITLIEGITDNPYTITELEGGIVYDFYVRSICDGGDVSPWCTMPASATPFFIQMGTNGSETISGCGFTITDDGGINGDYSSDCDYTLTINPPAPNFLVSISGTFAGEGTIDYLSVYEGTSTSGILLEKITSGTSGTTVNFGPLTSESGPLTLLFHSDYSMQYAGFVAQVTCIEMTGCPRPSNFTVNEITSSSINLSWRGSEDASAWNVAYGPTPFTPTEDSPYETVYDTTTTIDGLTSGTSYDFYVQANCGTEPSAWRGPLTATPGVFIFGTTGSSSITACDLTIYDNGGPDGNYTSNCNYTLTVYPSDPDSVVSVSGTYNTESGWDYLYIYSGTSANDGNLIETYAGSGSFGPITSEAGPLTLRFYSDGSTQYSGFAVTVSCVEAPDCRTPYALTASNIAADEATITWTADEGATIELYYKKNSESTWTVVDASEFTDVNTYLMTNLDPATTYNVYVANICTDDTLTSATISFTTLCAAVTAPYSENFTGFNTAMSPCWERFSGLASTVFNGGAMTPTTSGWNFSSSNVFPIGHPKINIYYTSCNYWLVSPSIDLSQLSEPTLMFSLALTDYGNEDPIEQMGNQADDKFIVAISTDNGATWLAANATVWDNTASGDYSYDSISTTGEDIAISLSQYAGQTIRIAFYGESTVSGGDNDLHIANVVVDEAPSCPRPNQLTSTATTTSSITLSWTPGGDETSWNVEYGPAGFNPGEGTTMTGVTNPVTISGLSASTTYNFYVQAECGGGETSAWSNVYAATTDCDIVTVLPYTENFDNISSGNANAFPICWARPIQYSGYPYAVTAYQHSAPASLRFQSLTTTPTTAVTPQFAEDIHNLQLNFWLKAESTTSSGTFEIGVMTDPNDVSTFVGVWTIQPTSTSWIEYTIRFDTTAVSGTNQYIAFRQHSNASNYYYWLDDVEISLNDAPVITDPTVATNAATSIGQTYATLNATITNPSGVTITAKGFEWRANSESSYTQIAGTGTGNTFTANLTTLIANTDYTYKAFITFNGTTVYGSEMTFTTLPEDVEPCAAPTGLTVNTITNNSATISWTAVGDATSWIVLYKQQSASQWQNATVQTTSFIIEGLTANTNYDVKVKAVCSTGIESDEVSTSFTTTGVGIDNITLANSISLMPNPADNYIELRINSNVTVKEAVVYNAFGQMVQTVELNNNEARIDLSGMASGMYFVRVNGDNMTATKKFIKR